METVTGLSAIQSRWMEYESACNETLNLLLDYLEEQGNEARLDSIEFSFHGATIRSANVVVDFPGTLYPERQVLVGAHWDCQAYPESWTDSTARAPGAVDNASGVAAVLEVARLLKDAETENSLRLILLAAEEVGLKASRPIAQQWHQEDGPDSLICFLNVDMVGYDADEADLTIVCDDISVDLAASLLPLAGEICENVRLDTLEVVFPAHSSSDHHWFWFYGLPALWLHEGPEDAFPLANTMQDTLGAVNPAFLRSSTQALLGMVWQLAGVEIPGREP
jgi:Zn-dependent M28 family amino/carboxypeptidase